MPEKNSFHTVSSSDLKRLVLIALFVFLLFCFLIMQFFKIQIIQGDRWSKTAKQQHQHLVIEPFKRGAFFSNTSVKTGHPESAQPFVMDVPKFHLYIDPDSFIGSTKDEAAEFISDFFHFQKKERDRVFAEFHKESRSRKLVMWLEPEVQANIQQWWQDFARKKKLARNALFFVQDYKRSYPFGSLLGQVLHTIQEEKDNRTFQALPTGGLELQFHPYLKGRIGKRVILRSPTHPLDKGRVIEKPLDGADVYLTINHYLQAIAEEELERGIASAGAKGGWAVMMDPETGEILALAQYPPFDPRNYREYFNDPLKQEHSRLKAVTDAFEPGSIFKPITLAIGFLACEELKKKGQSPFFHPQEKMPTLSRKFPGTSFTLKDGHDHHYLNMYQAVQKSSNIYVGRIIQKVIETMGENWYRSQLVDLFGFGKKTGIEVPGETLGQVPTPGKLHPNKKLEWSVPTPYSLAIGHNILVNSMQMVRMYAAFANGGYEVTPTIVRKIVKKTDEGVAVILDNTARKKGKRILPPEIVDELVKAMRFTTKLGGTSPRADIRGYTEAGKSGSSEKIIDGKYSKDRYISSFVGFAPVHKPRFVLMVTVDEPAVKYIPGAGKNYLGGVCATPIFREIGARALAYLGVEPDDTGSMPGTKEPPEWSKEVKELRDLYIQWNQ